MFPYYFNVDPNPIVSSDGITIKGSFRHEAGRTIRVGTPSKTDPRIGYVIYKDGTDEALFEDRASDFQTPVESSKDYEFSIKLPSFIFDEFDRVHATIDLVLEDKFWFGELPEFRNSIKLELHAPEIRDAGKSGKGARDPKQIAPTASAEKTHRGEGRISENRIVFDISDLVQFWRDNIRPTGIQRVQIEVLRSVLTVRPEGDGRNIYRLIHFDADSHAWLEMPLQSMSELIVGSEAVDADLIEWQDKLSYTVSSNNQYQPSRGDILVNLGSSWWIPDYLHKVEILRSKYGVRYVPFIHDVIPLVVPQYCDENLVDEFRLWFREASTAADHIIVNSDASRRDVISYSIKLNGREPAVSVAKLNARFKLPRERHHSSLLERHNLDIEPFVLCVGTLEARKNHALLFQAWDELARRRGIQELPRLVLVGKKGWMFEYAQTLLKRSPALKEKVLTLSGISDSELAELYQGCLFSVFPSFYEGWGLPVTEAVFYEKLCIASNTSSIPEAGSAGAIYLDPHDLQAWVSTLEDVIFRPRSLSEAEEASRAAADLRSWDDVASDIIAACATFGEDVAGHAPTQLLDGRIYDFRMETARKNFSCSAKPFRAGAGWHHLEDFGTWTAPGLTKLQFSVRSSEPRYLYLTLQGAPEDASVVITVNRHVRAERRVNRDERVLFRFDLTPGNDGVCDLRLTTETYCDLAKLTGGGDRRRIGIAFLNMMVCEHGDIDSRLNYSEAMGMQFAP